MSYTNESKNFIYTIEQEKQMMLYQEGINEAKMHDEILKKYVRGIVEKTMSPGLSIRRIIDEKYVDISGRFEYEGECIEDMPYFDMCDNNDELNKYRDAFKILAKKKNIVCENKQYKTWIEATHNYSISRKMLFKIAFILGLSKDETEEWLVNKLMMQGINLRDIDEVVYEYCLKTNLKFEEAEKLIQECKEIIKNNKKMPPICRQSTTFLSEEVVNLLSREELLSYVKDNASEFDKISHSRSETFKELCDEAKDLIMEVSEGSAFTFDSSREDTIFEKSNRVLGNMLTFGVPIVDDAEYKVRVRDDRLSKDITQNELGAQRIDGIIKGKINVDRKDILWLQFFIRAMKIQNADVLHIDTFDNTRGIDNAESFRAYMDDFLPTLGYGGLYYANAFDNIIFFSMLDERPYETFLIMLDEAEECEK